MDNDRLFREGNGSECGMSLWNIVIGQKVDPDKVQRAKEFRRHMTVPERILWRHLRKNRLCGRHFRRQQIIDGFIVDFYCHSTGLVVEVDGKVHEGRTAYDAERGRVLAARGLRIIRIRNEEIRKDLPGVLARIAASAQEISSPAREEG